jgi:parallel beta-helix repeat protein
MFTRTLLSVLALTLGALVGPAAAASLDIRSPDPTQPYTFRLASHQQRPIRILSDHVTLDCQHHRVMSDGWGYVGIEAFGVENVTIANCFVLSWPWGIRVSQSPNTTVRDNTLLLNGTGITFEDGSSTITLTDNVIQDNGLYGLEIRSSPGVIRLTGNHFLFNGPRTLAQSDRRRHFVILSRGLVTKPLEQFENVFTPPLTPVE